MTVPNIDTFEHDIAEEIKHKDATLGDIAAASGNIGNMPTPRDNSAILLIVVSVVLIFGSLFALYFGYTYYNNKVNPAPRAAPAPLPVTTDTSLLPTLSPFFASSFGYVVTNVTRSDYGYTITFSSYPTVFSYMLKNEADYADDIATAVGSPRVSTTSPAFTFSDVTINNQNMRVGASGSSTVVYAFTSGTTLSIASSTQNILSLRNAILH